MGGRDREAVGQVRLCSVLSENKRHCRGFFLKAAQKRAQCERSLLEMSAGAGGNEWLEPRCEFVRVRKSEGCAAVCMLHLVKCQRNLLPATGTQ